MSAVMSRDGRREILAPLVNSGEDRDEKYEENDDDEADDFAADAVEADANRIRSARWLARSHRFGVNFDPERPIYRVWTNIRGTKVHALIVIGLIIMFYSYFGYRAGEKDAGILDTFTLHVVSMLCAWALMSDGLVAYRAGTIGSNSLESLRYRHRRIMICCALCMLCGIASIVAHKVDEGHSLVPHSYHAILGVCIIVFMLPQVRVGLVKMRKLLYNQGKSYRWHGNFGQLLYSLVAVNVALGFMEIEVESVTAFWLFCSGFVVSTITVIAAMYQPTIFGSDQFDQAAPTRDITEHDVELMDYDDGRESNSS